LDVLNIYMTDNTITLTSFIKECFSNTKRPKSLFMYWYDDSSQKYIPQEVHITKE